MRLTIPREDFDALRKAADADDRTPPLMARVLIREGLAKRGVKAKKG